MYIHTYNLLEFLKQLYTMNPRLPEQKLRVQLLKRLRLKFWSPVSITMKVSCVMTPVTSDSFT